jgi:hypothetical protein
VGKYQKGSSGNTVGGYGLNTFGICWDQWQAFVNTLMNVIVP